MCRWTQWDGTGRVRHWIDPSAHTIYYYRQYIARGGYSRSGTNQLILNLKKPPTSPESQYHYKLKAISEFATDLAALFKPAQADYCLTWMPPSKSEGDPLYDDRLEQVVRHAAKLMPRFYPIKTFSRSSSQSALHQGGKRHPNEIASSLKWEESDLTHYAAIVVVDDVLTTGASFRAIYDKIHLRYPMKPVIGVVWAITIDDPDIDIF